MGNFSHWYYLPFQSFLLKEKKRRMRLQLSQFFDTVILYLETGFDLGFAWPEALGALQHNMEPDLVNRLKVVNNAPLSEVLEALSKDKSDTQTALWFSILYELYTQGSALLDAFAAASDTLRRDHERDLARHIQKLPTQANIMLLIFFMPPTMWLLFAPLLLSMFKLF